MVFLSVSHPRNRQKKTCTKLTDTSLTKVEIKCVSCMGKEEERKSVSE